MGTNFVNICMSDILACVECFLCHYIALRWGVTQVGKFHYWTLLTPSWEHIFQVPKTHWGWDASGALEAKKWPSWPYLVFFVNFLARNPVFYKL